MATRSGEGAESAGPPVIRAAGWLGLDKQGQVVAPRPPRTIPAGASADASASRSIRSRLSTGCCEGVKEKEPAYMRPQKEPYCEQAGRAAKGGGVPHLGGLGGGGGGGAGKHGRLQCARSVRVCTIRRRPLRENTAGVRRIGVRSQGRTKARPTAEARISQQAPSTQKPPGPAAPRANAWRQGRALSDGRSSTSGRSKRGSEGGIAITYPGARLV